MQKKKNKNYWPHGIIISILLIVAACIYTIVEAVKYPVELDTYYFDTKENVDRNYDKIKAAQESFDKKYTTFVEINDIQNGTLRAGENNKIRIVINDKDKNSCDFNADIKLLLTRPETNKYNEDIAYSYAEKCRWFFAPFT
ncbi:MAG: hypothetical protein LBC08_02395, partial [Campylobacteraceae bacterium]|nr:hypothetical protein [Campylobacteraceae bacterium]